MLFLEQIDQGLLIVHITAGVAALVAASLALLSEKGRDIHVKAGRLYFWCMLLIFITALPLSVLRSNIFLFLIAFFSFYLAFSGKRFAVNRRGTFSWIDQGAACIMLLSGLGMVILGIRYFIQDNSQFLVLIVFSLLALSLGYRDFALLRAGGVRGKERIAKHLTNMLGGTIAVITAVLVVNVQINQQWILWILPTLLITPLIIWWSNKTLRS